MEFNCDKNIPDGYKRRDPIPETYGSILLSYFKSNERENRNKIVYYSVDYVIYRRKNSLFIIFYDYSFMSEKLDVQIVKDGVNDYIKLIKSSNMQGIRSIYLNRKITTFHIKDIINII